MQIRAALPADTPQLLALVRRYWDFEGIAGFEALRIELVLKELLTPQALRGAVWVAEEAGQLHGYLIVVLVMSVEHQGLMAEIDEFFVLPEVRARGLGGQLLAQAESALAARGCVRLQLQLNRANQAARDFYARRGYRPRADYELLDRALR